MSLLQMRAHIGKRKREINMFLGIWIRGSYAIYIRTDVVVGKHSFDTVGHHLDANFSSKCPYINQLWNMARLVTRGWPNQHTCSLCHGWPETTVYLFVHCSYVVQHYPQSMHNLHTTIQSNPAYQTTQPLFCSLRHSLTTTQKPITLTLHNLLFRRTKRHQIVLSYSN